LDWTIADYYDDDVRQSLGDRRTEIADGILIDLPSQGLQTVRPLSRLRRLVEAHLLAERIEATVHTEVDLLLRDDRVPRPDALLLTAEQERQQATEEASRPTSRSGYHPVYVTPALIIESISVGTEQHDRRTKRAWYAEAGVPHYWLLSHADRSLICLRLVGSDYVEAAQGAAPEEIEVPWNGFLKIPLARLFV
jgi:Uma2 family endonuclease